jgi:uncharacterized protein
MPQQSRREFLRNGGTAAIACAFAPAALAARAADPMGPADEPLGPFPPTAVRLGPGLFQDQAQINERYLDSLDNDRLLHSFRLTAGIASSVTPYGGWEDPNCELRGHFSGGHSLSALALAGASGNGDLRSKGHRLVAELAHCQKQIGTGYLSAYPADLFEGLAQGKPVWAPFYTYHKIMAGLLDMHVLADDSAALAVAEGMARWAGNYFAGMSVERRQRILRTEYGGMNEALVNLAAITQKQRYLDTARLFEQPSILDPLAERRDELQGLHANTNIPKIIGAARMYEVTGERRYRQIAEYFLEEVLTARNYAIGNTSEDEHWKTPPGRLQGTLGWRNAECCVAYNLMKLQRLVFSWTAQSRWMDDYERALFNCRMGTQEAHGLKQYFVPLASGYWRAYNSAEDSFWCCTGTGAEEFAKLTDTIFFHRGGDIYVNQFIPATLEWRQEGLTLEQLTRFPTEPATTIKVIAARPAARTIHVRVPAWTAGRAEVRLNGQPLEAAADPGAYVSIRRVWRPGDTLAIQLPMRLRQESLLGDDSVNAVLFGPLVLAADLGPGPADGPFRVVHGRPTEPENLPPASPLPMGGSKGAWVERTSKTELRFRASGSAEQHNLLPLYEIGSQRYAVYWQSKST